MILFKVTIKKKWKCYKPVMNLVPDFYLFDCRDSGNNREMKKIFSFKYEVNCSRSPTISDNIHPVALLLWGRREFHLHHTLRWQWPCEWLPE
jgi:hypothetical protein